MTAGTIIWVTFGKRVLQTTELMAAESSCSDQGFTDVQTKCWWIIGMLLSHGTTTTSRTVYPISVKPSINLTSLWKTPSPSHIAEKTNRFFSTDPGKSAPDPSVELHTHHHCGLWAHTKPSHPRPDRWLQGGLCICLKTSNENISLRNHSSTAWVGRTFPARKHLSSAVAYIISRCSCKDLCLQKE